MKNILLCEDYPLSYEDVDYCLRTRQRGWRVVYCGQAFAVHDEGATGEETGTKNLTNDMRKNCNPILRFGLGGETLQVPYQNDVHIWINMVSKFLKKPE